jgi:acetyltransferase-like isoleucine patch superfamily enzyme
VSRIRQAFGPGARLFAAWSALWRRIYWRNRLFMLGEGSRLYPHVRIYGAQAVSLGRNVVINDFVHIWGSGGVELGDDTLVAAHCTITSQTHAADALRRGKLYRDTNRTASVKIGSNVWIGSGAIILPGVTIGDNSIVAAGAVVRSDVPSGVLVAGVPARVVRSLAIS